MIVGLIYAKDNADELVAIIISNKHRNKKALEKDFRQVFEKNNSLYQDLAVQEHEGFDQEEDLINQCKEYDINYVPSWVVIDPHKK